MNKQKNEEELQNRKTAIQTSLKGVIYLVLVMVGIFAITSLMKLTGLSMVDQDAEVKAEKAEWEEAKRVKDANKKLQLKTEEDENANEGIASLPLGMYLSVVKYEDGILTVLIDNQSGYKMEYHESWTIEYEENGTWQEFGAGSKEAEEKALLLLDLTKASIECDLNQIGELKAGNYRILVDDLQAEFVLEEIEE